MKVDKDKLVIAMARAELSNKELAERAGVTPYAITKVRTNGTCRGTTLGAIARVLDMDVTELMAEGS